MSTAADALVELISDWYGETAEGGAFPAHVVNLVDYRSLSPARSNEESIVVQLPVPARRTPITQGYSNVEHRFTVRISTPTSDTRMKEISDEVRRIISTYMVGGVNVQYSEDESDVSDRRKQVFRYEMMVIFIENMALPSTTYEVTFMDQDAIHDNEDGEIYAITIKNTPVDADVLLIEDSAASWAKKRVTLGDLPGGGGGPGSGTQWTIPVWDTTSTLGDSMILQDSGGTAATVSGSLTVSTIAAGVADYDKFIVSDAGVLKFRTGTEVLSDLAAYTSAQVDSAIDTDITTHAGVDNAHHEVFESGDFTTAFAAEDFNNLATTAHVLASADHTVTGLTAGDILSADTATTYSWKVNPAATVPLALTDLASYTQGSIIIGGGADWEVLTAGTEDWVLTMGADEPVWAVSASGGPGSGTQWTIPVWNTTSTLGDSMVTQDSGGTAFSVGGSLTVTSIVAEATDVDKFLVSNAGLVKFRTGAEVASDIGAVSLPVLEANVTFDGAGHAHTGTTGGALLDWDTCWTDAVHSHASDAEGSTLTWANALAAAAAGSHDHSDNTKGDAVPEGSITFSATGHDHDGSGSENVDYTNLDSIPGSFTPAAHVLATSGPHTDTLPVADITNGTDGYYLKAGASNPVYEQRTFTIGGSILSPTDATYVVAFRAPFACTAVEINAYQKGGSSTVINARKNGSSNLLASNLTLTTTATWYNDAADQNQSFAVDDWLEIMVVTAASATEVFIQVEFTED